MFSMDSGGDVDRIPVISYDPYNFFRQNHRLIDSLVEPALLILYL